MEVTDPDKLAIETAAEYARRLRHNERAKKRRRQRRREDPEFGKAEARRSKAYRDRKRGGPPSQRRRKSMDQIFTRPELEAATRLVELVARGGDPAVILKTDAHRSYMRKLLELRKKARRRAQ